MFAARPNAMRVALSPDAMKIVYVGSFKTGGRAVMVADLTTGTSKIVMSTPDLSLRPEWCQFKSAQRLICGAAGILTTGHPPVAFHRIIAIDSDGSNGRMIGQEGYRADRTFYGGRVLNWLPDDPNKVVMAVSADDYEGLAVAHVDVRSGPPRVFEQASRQVYDVATDATGAVRYRSLVDQTPGGYDRDSVTHWVRPKGSREWKLLIRGSLSDDHAPKILGFDATGDNILVLKLLDGRQALYSVSTDGANTATLLFAHPSVDVDGVLRIGKYRRPVAATFSLDRDEYKFFDSKLSALNVAISAALPGHPNVSVLDESWDGTAKLIFVDGDNLPGRYFLYNTTTKRLGALVSVYPALDDVAMGIARAVRYAAADGTPIPGYLTLPPGRTDIKGLPALVMPHGGPSARDTAGFDWLAQFFAAKGYAVLQPNFRGSTGFGVDYFAKNGFRSWPLAVGDINDGARWMVAQGADAKLLAIFGWSYGGYAALQANVVDPKLYKATIAIAPVTDLMLLRREALDFSNYKQIDAMIGNGPHVAAGSPARNAKTIQTPVLIFHGDKDQNVDIEQSRVMASALRSAGKTVELVEYKGLNHQLDDSDARRDLLTRSATLLEKAMR